MLTCFLLPYSLIPLFLASLLPYSNYSSLPLANPSSLLNTQFKSLLLYDDSGSWLVFTTRLLMLVSVLAPGAVSSLLLHPFSLTVSPVGCMGFTRQSKRLLLRVGVADRCVAISTLQSFPLGCKENGNHCWSRRGNRGTAELEI